MTFHNSTPDIDDLFGPWEGSPNLPSTNTDNNTLLWVVLLLGVGVVLIGAVAYRNAVDIERMND